MAGAKLRDAVDVKCRDCIYCPDAPGGWRQQVAECLSMDCALYAVRARPLPVRGRKATTP